MQPVSEGRGSLRGLVPPLSGSAPGGSWTLALKPSMAPCVCWIMGQQLQLVGQPHSRQAWGFLQPPSTLISNPPTPHFPIPSPPPSQGLPDAWRFWMPALLCFLKSSSCCSRLSAEMIFHPHQGSLDSCLSCLVPAVGLMRPFALGAWPHAGFKTFNLIVYSLCFWIIKVKPHRTAD